jgi:hypothetical protein
MAATEGREDGGGADVLGDVMEREASEGEVVPEERDDDDPVLFRLLLKCFCC